MSINNSKIDFVVLGAGPTGLSVVQSLLERNVSPDRILVIDKAMPTSLVLAPKIRPTINEVFKFNTEENGLTKINPAFGRSLDELSESYRWGAAMLSPTKEVIETWGINETEFDVEYSKVMLSWDVQATPTKKVEDSMFSVSGCNLDEYPRKHISNEVVANHSKIFYSRLAVQHKKVSGGGCDFRGTCFYGCERNAIWNPLAEITKIKKSTDVEFLEDKILNIDFENKKLTLTNGQISYDNLFLSCGWKTTVELIQKLFLKKIEVDVSPVTLVPFLLKKKVDDYDYFDHNVLVDCYLPLFEGSTVTSFTQIYFPTSEVSGRALAQISRFIPKKIINLSPIPNFFFKRLGVAMVFEPAIEGTTLSDTKNRSLLRQLKSEFAKFNSSLLTLFGIKLPLGTSYHAGAIHLAGENNKGINSEIFRILSLHKVFLSDTSALPSVEPGPHTSVAAAIARLVANKI
jgi:hypothetical protein